MKKTIWTGALTAIVGLAGAGLMAQATAPQQTTTPQTNTASSSDKKVTITGCLRAAPETTTAGATGTTGTTGTAGSAAGTTGAADSADAKYVLTDASMKPADTAATTSPQTPSTSPAPSTTTAGSSGQTYRLIANPAALTQHVGKKLELTGTLEEDHGPAATNGAAGGAAEAKSPALRVESGKIVANSCSQ